jgi:hypothetical protein
VILTGATVEQGQYRFEHDPIMDLTCDSSVSRPDRDA